MVVLFSLFLFGGASVGSSLVDGDGGEAFEGDVLAGEAFEGEAFEGDDFEGEAFVGDLLEVVVVESSAFSSDSVIIIHLAC